MLDIYEQWKIIGYMCCILESKSLNAKAVCEVCQFIEINHAFMGIGEGQDELDEELNEFQDTLNDSSVRRQDVRSIAARLFSLLHNHQQSIDLPEPSKLERNLVVLGKELGFDKADEDLFNFLTRYFTHLEFRSFLVFCLSWKWRIGPVELAS